MSITDMREMRTMLQSLIGETVQQLSGNDHPRSVIVTEVIEPEEEAQGASMPFCSPPSCPEKQDIAPCFPLLSFTGARASTYPEDSNSSYSISQQPFSRRQASLDVPARILLDFAKPREEEAISKISIVPSGKSQPLVPDLASAKKTMLWQGNPDELPACAWCGGRTWWRRKEDGLLICECYLALVERDAALLRDESVAT